MCMFCLHNGERRYITLDPSTLECAHVAPSMRPAIVSRYLWFGTHVNLCLAGVIRTVAINTMCGGSSFELDACVQRKEVIRKMEHGIEFY